MLPRLASRAGFTPVWRTDRAANCGADPNGHVNECVLQAFALLAFYVDMEPRAHADAHVGPDPQSSMNCLRGVHRSHEEKGITMASTKFASKVLKGLMRKYVKNCGIRSVRRKKPLTNAKINAMLNTPQGGEPPRRYSRPPLVRVGGDGCVGQHSGGGRRSEG